MTGCIRMGSGENLSPIISIYYTSISIKLCKKKNQFQQKQIAQDYISTHTIYKPLQHGPRLLEHCIKVWGGQGLGGTGWERAFISGGIMEQTSNMRGTEEQKQLLGTGNIENHDFDFGEQCDTRELVTRVSTAGPHFP